MSGGISEPFSLFYPERRSLETLASGGTLARATPGPTFALRNSRAEARSTSAWRTHALLAAFAARDLFGPVTPREAERAPRRDAKTARAAGAATRESLDLLVFGFGRSRSIIAARACVSASFKTASSSLSVTGTTEIAALLHERHLREQRMRLHFREPDRLHELLHRRDADRAPVAFPPPSDRRRPSS